MAFNNYFFFDSLSPKPQPLKNYDTLERSLIHTFGSIENLKRTMIDTAAAMFGPGFVWLVWSGVPGRARDTMSKEHAWRILITYNAGTPFSEAGYRQQGVDMNNQSATSSAQAMSRMQAQHTTINNAVGTFGAASRSGQDAAAYPPGAARVDPVLCVNTWEHVYLFDYNVERKSEYLNNWWDCVDWGTVDRRAPQEAKSQQRVGQGSLFGQSSTFEH